MHVQPLRGDNLRESGGAGIAAVRALVCIDDRLLSRAILPTAVRVVELTGAELEFLHVLDPHQVSSTARRPPGGPLGDPGFVGVAEDHGQALARRDVEIREELEAELRAVPGFARVVILHERDPAKAIVSHSEETHPDVIVMATRAQRGVAGVLSGSTTQKVIRSGVAPVLVVHPAD